MKNNILKYIVFAVLGLTFSCDKNFEEINTNEVDPTSASVDPVFLLNNAIINTSIKVSSKWQEQIEKF